MLTSALSHQILVNLKQKGSYAMQAVTWLQPAPTPGGRYT